MAIDARKTEHGFVAGALQVAYHFGDEETGTVCVGLQTKTIKLDVYVTKSGKVRIVQGDGVEWKAEKVKRRHK